MIGRRRQRPVERVEAEALPAVNSLVTLARTDGADWPERGTRVEGHEVDADGLLLAVAAPTGAAGELEPPGVGAPFAVSWPGERGVVVLPTELVDRASDGVRLWWLRPTGALAVSQRRQHVRAEVVGWPVRVGLTWVLPEERNVDGDLLDLSEGGLRALVPAWSQGDGTPVALRLTLARADDSAQAVEVDELELFGTVLRSRPASGGGVEVVVHFHEGDAGVGRGDADRLRAVVFAWQRQARASQAAGDGRARD